MSDDELKSAIEVAMMVPHVTTEIHITPEQLPRVRELWPTKWDSTLYGTGKNIEVPKRLDNVRLVLALPEGMPRETWGDQMAIVYWTDKLQEFRPLVGGLAVKVGDGPVTILEGDFR